MEQARQQVETLKQLADESPQDLTQRQRRARPRAARASTTDPEARVMQFPDGGYRPGYNVEFATDTATGVIVGVEVTNAGSDQEQWVPMLDQRDARYGRRPKEALVDGGFASLLVEKLTASVCAYDLGIEQVIPEGAQMGSRASELLGTSAERFGWNGPGGRLTRVLRLVINRYAQGLGGAGTIALGGLRL